MFEEREKVNGVVHLYIYNTFGTHKVNGFSVPERLYNHATQIIIYLSQIMMIYSGGLIFNFEMI